MNKECINEVKDLLSYLYCDNHECKIYDDKSALFFDKLLKEDSRFKSPVFSGNKTYITIRLCTYLLNEDKKYPLAISYCYDCDRDGEDWESYRFADEDVNYNYNWLKPYIKFEYSEVPDDVWESIKNYIYNKVKVKLNEDVIRAKEYYLHKAKEDYEEALDKYNKLINKYE